MKKISDLNVTKLTVGLKILLKNKYIHPIIAITVITSARDSERVGHDIPHDSYHSKL